ncbi:Uu.00g080920.m01.CDS01 [Anthostomella pinea]|uniref:RNA-binding protein VTS1 n=1 Tax=Anthostomella pinea TaxID=933095 RepID=A0AAI8VL26_9PEZI|nr:Uu.00g080920.m01.CDS01 [Anthostomella pinea]
MNRNSTPEASAASSLRPPRTVGTAQHLRASADMATLAGPASSNRIRPSSDFYGQQGQGQGGGDSDPQEKVTQQWIADIDQYETTLEEMAAATLDQDFKDELSAIEQWFRVLSEAERTAALYALLQQTTQVQIRFFIQVLQQMGKNHPMSGVLSPSNFDKDPMSNRLSDAMGKLNVTSARNSISQPQASAKRLSALDPETIKAMFPDAAAAIETEKAKFTQQTGNQPPSNRNSAAVDVRSSLAAPTISGPSEGRDSNGQNPNSLWSNDQGGSRPKSSSGQAPMGQFVQPPPSAGLRSPRPQMGGNGNIQSTTLNAPDNSASDMPMLSPYGGSGNWASMVNTPMVGSFNTGNAASNQADMVANATAMKLAALSTVNNRFALDDPRKYRRARSNDAPGQNQGGISAGPQAANFPGTNFVMVNEHGQVMNRDQVLAIQNQQSMSGMGHMGGMGNMGGMGGMGGFGAHRSRPNSPGIALQPAGLAQQMAFASPQTNGYLSASQNPLLSSGMGTINMGQFGVGAHEGYLSDHSDMVRGRSPRGRRGTSKPPEDPTDPTLLQDIPAWLRSLRLHKYTDNLKDLKWTDLVEMDDEALEKRGVNALGARRKMLKVFEQVRDAKADGKLA